MGKGTIISGGTGGQYQVELALKRDRIQARITAMTAQIMKIDARIAASTNDHEISMLTLQKTALQKRIIYLNNQPSDPTVSAWCADLTEDLTGEVGTIEVPGERGEVNIQPGHGGNAAYDQARDGQLGLNWNLGPAGAAYNLAMLPGWQKWKPTYRYGTITAIDGDTCDVSLDVAGSSQLGLNVNQSQTLTVVTIEYMNCNGAAFEVGDEVLVKFGGQNFGSPKVIGFKENPQPCTELLYFVVSAANKSSRCIVWDIAAKAMATGILKNGGEPAVFPCNPSDISNWYATTSPGESVADLYEGYPNQVGEHDDLFFLGSTCDLPTICCEIYSGVYARSGECERNETEISANVDRDGAPLENWAILNRSGTCPSVPGDCVQVDERLFEMEMQAKTLDLAHPTLYSNIMFGSNLLTMLNMDGGPQTSIRTMKAEESSFEARSSSSEMYPFGCNCPTDYKHQSEQVDYTIMSPLGAMTPVGFLKTEDWVSNAGTRYEELVGWRDPGTIPIQARALQAKYTDRSIVQVFIYAVSKWTRERTEPDWCWHWVNMDPPAWTYTNRERIVLCHAQADYLETTENVDPRTLVRDALETAVINLINTFHSDNSAESWDVLAFSTTMQILQ